MGAIASKNKGYECLIEYGTVPIVYDTRCVRPEKVIYNDPATIVFWSDGTKTVVRCHEGDVFDRREGFLLCCAKKLMGNKGAYNDAMREHCPDKHVDTDLLGSLVDAINEKHPPKVVRRADIGNGQVVITDEYPVVRM